MDEFGRFWKVAVALWVFGALLSIGIVGTLIWGVVKLVLHFT